MRRNAAVHICGGPEPLKIPNPDCPNAAAHEPFPAGYLAAYDYAEELMKTKTQEAPCPGCGLWHIWTPKVDA